MSPADPYRFDTARVAASATQADLAPVSPEPSSPGDAHSSVPADPMGASPEPAPERAEPTPSGAVGSTDASSIAVAPTPIDSFAPPSAAPTSGGAADAQFKVATSLELELAYRDLEGAAHSHTLAVSFDTAAVGASAASLPALVADPASPSPDSGAVAGSGTPAVDAPFQHGAPATPTFFGPQDSLADWLDDLSLPTRDEDGGSILDRAETIIDQGLDALGVSDAASALDPVLSAFADTFDLTPLSQAQDLISNIDLPLPDLGLLDILSPSSSVGGSLLAGLFAGDQAQPSDTPDLGALDLLDTALPDLGELSNGLLALHSGSGIGGLIDHDPFEGLFG